MQCPQHLTLWHISILKLSHHLLKSKFCCLLPLSELKAWLDQAEMARDVRWGTVGLSNLILMQMQIFEIRKIGNGRLLWQMVS